MTRPDLTLVAQQLQAVRAAQVAEFFALSPRQQLDQAASYRDAKQKGDQMFHPYAAAIQEVISPTKIAA